MSTEESRVEDMEDGELEDGECDDDVAEQAEVPQPAAASPHKQQQQQGADHQGQAKKARSKSASESEQGPVDALPKEGDTVVAGDHSAGSDNEESKDTERRDDKSKERGGSDKRREERRKRKKRKKDERDKKKRKRHVDHDRQDDAGEYPDEPMRWPGYGDDESPPDPYASPQRQQQDYSAMYPRGGGGDPYSTRSPPGPYDSPYDSPRGPYDTPSGSDNEYDGPPDKVQRQNTNKRKGRKQTMLSMLDDDGYMDASVAANEKEDIFRQGGGRITNSNKQRKKELRMKQYRERREERERGDGSRSHEAERPNCRFWHEGKCHRGENCPYNHDFDPPPRRADICKFYLSGFCQKGNGCNFMHSEYPCKYYHTGRVCFAGDNCKFSHAELTDETRPLAEKFMRGPYGFNDHDSPRKGGHGERGDGGGMQGEGMHGDYNRSPPRDGKSIPSLFDIKVFPPSKPSTDDNDAMGGKNGAPKHGQNNMNNGPNNMNNGPNNMNNGPNNMNNGPNNMNMGAGNMHMGPNNMNNGPNSMNMGPNNMNMGPNNMNMGPNSMNMGPGPNSMNMGPNSMNMGPNNMNMGPNNMNMGPNMGPNNMNMGPSGGRPMGPGFYNQNMGNMNRAPMRPPPQQAGPGLLGPNPNLFMGTAMAAAVAARMLGPMANAPFMNNNDGTNHNNQGMFPGGFGQQSVQQAPRMGDPRNFTGNDKQSIDGSDDGAGQDESGEDRGSPSNYDIPEHLPPMQRELFRRIQQHQRENPPKDENDEAGKGLGDENWYSSDEEESSNKHQKAKMADLVKMLTPQISASTQPLQQQAPPSFNQAPPSFNQAPPSFNQAPPSFSQAPPSFSQAPPSFNQAPPSFNIAQMLSAIKGTSPADSNLSPKSEPRPYEDPRQSAKPSDPRASKMDPRMVAPAQAAPPEAPLIDSRDTADSFEYVLRKIDMDHKKRDLPPGVDWTNAAFDQDPRVQRHLQMNPNLRTQLIIPKKKAWAESNAMGIKEGSDSHTDPRSSRQQAVAPIKIVTTDSPSTPSPSTPESTSHKSLAIPTSTTPPSLLPYLAPLTMSASFSESAKTKKLVVDVPKPADSMPLRSPTLDPSELSFSIKKPVDPRISRQTSNVDKSPKKKKVPTATLR